MNASASAVTANELLAVMGAPTPVNTVWLSRSSRAPKTASSSVAVTADVGAFEL